MARSAFETVIRLQLDRYGPQEAQRRHVAAAKAGLAAYLGTQVPRPGVKLEVDGHAAAREEEVKPFGIIVYRFLRMGQIIPYALKMAREFSPVGEANDTRPGHPGLYRESWFTLVEGRKVDVADIPPEAEVILTNNQPYSRKINTGAKGFERYVPPGIVEKVRQAVLAKFGNLVEAQIVFLDLEAAYTLKHDLRHIYRGRRYGAPRNDARAGMPITYPGVLFSPRQFG